MWINKGIHIMRDDKAEIAARYHVVELLYRGDLEGAEQSLDSFSQDQTISPDTAAFYRFLLGQARCQEPEQGTLGELQPSAETQGQTDRRVP